MKEEERGKRGRDKRKTKSRIMSTRARGNEDGVKETGKSQEKRMRCIKEKERRQREEGIRGK